MAHRHPWLLAWLTATVAILACAAPCRAAWDPIPPDELSSTAPALDPNADAEVLDCRVELDDEVFPTGLQTRRVTRTRIRVFTAGGVERFGRVQIQYPQDSRLRDVSARAVLPDGGIRELDPRAAFDDVLIRVRGERLRQRSFVIPGVVPGAIVECRYTILRFGELTHLEPLEFQREIPVRRVVYAVKPLDVPGWVMAYRTFNLAVERSPKPVRGFVEFSAHDLPAFREEEWAPPEAQVKAWMMLWYRSAEDEMPGGDADAYWRRVGRDEAVEFDEWTRPDRRTRDLAAKLTAGLGTAREKADRLFDHCRASLRVLQSTSPESLKAARMKECSNAGDVLEQGGGTARDVNYGFAALARAAGLSVRLIKLAPKSFVAFDPRLADEIFLVSRQIAVDVGDAWYGYDVGERLLPAGMVSWDEEAQLALLCAKDSSRFVLTPCSPPERSARVRVADLTLADDGRISGTGRVELRGHLAARVCRGLSSTDDRELLGAVRDVTGLRVRDEDWAEAKLARRATPWDPVVVEFPLELDSTVGLESGRLLVEPAMLSAGQPPLLSGQERRHEVVFPHAWCEYDTVRLVLPEGWRPEATESPRSIVVPDFARYELTIRYEPERARLVCARSFLAGERGTLEFPRGSFPALKTYFAKLQDADRSAVMLVRGKP